MALFRKQGCEVLQLGLAPLYKPLRDAMLKKSKPQKRTAPSRAAKDTAAHRPSAKANASNTRGIAAPASDQHALSRIKTMPIENISIDQVNRAVTPPSFSGNPKHAQPLSTCETSSGSSADGIVSISNTVELEAATDSGDVMVAVASGKRKVRKRAQAREKARLRYVAAAAAPLEIAEAEAVSAALFYYVIQLLKFVSTVLFPNVINRQAATCCRCCYNAYRPLWLGSKLTTSFSQVVGRTKIRRRPSRAARPSNSIRRCAACPGCCCELCRSSSCPFRRASFIHSKRAANCTR